MTSSKKRFVLFSILSLIVLVGLEWLINKSVLMEHIIGWLFLALFIGALAYLLNNKQEVLH